VNTPAPIIAKLNTEINAILAKPDVKDYIASQGANATGSTAEELAQRIKNEIAIWTDVVKKSGMRVD
jgi:tripartite-type tricarboxylate transporter receptor subunit TctC